MTETTEQQAAGSSRQWIIGAGGLVLAGAAIMVLFVLPAEFGIDPTGAGKALGLTEISDPGMSEEQRRGALREGVLTLSDEPFEPIPGQVTDQWVRQLGPFESIEFKYTLNEGEPLNFAWSASGPLSYDMHAHPFEGGEDMTESYGVDEARSMSGTYVPAFTGIHGWFWRNDSVDNVTLTLDASGSLTEATVFEGSAQIKREIVPNAAAAAEAEPAQ
ncbi:MAG TPA: hypothetical protein VLA37_09295 [Sphingomonadaceae bacterium]|nr:hypothetical protein [Sphingomonadaceae bacterium]